MSRQKSWLGLSFAVCLTSLGVLFRLVSASPTASITGKVILQDGGPVGGATVRIQSTTNSTTSTLDGSFSLDGLDEGTPVTVSAWKDKYYCAKLETVTPPTINIIFTLRFLHNITPNLHNGSAAMLYDVLVAKNLANPYRFTSQLSEQDLADLVAFLLALPYTE
jgi:hypothetical protein